MCPKIPIHCTYRIRKKDGGVVKDSHMLSCDQIWMTEHWNGSRLINYTQLVYKIALLDLWAWEKLIFVTAIFSKYFLCTGTELILITYKFTTLVAVLSCPFLFNLYHSDFSKFNLIWWHWYGSTSENIITVKCIQPKTSKT